MARIYRNFVDKLDPIKQTMRDLGIDLKTVMTKMDPYKLARMANDANAKVIHFLKKGTLDFKTLEVTGQGFEQITKRHKRPN